MIKGVNTMILNRFVQFNLKGVNEWESKKFNIYGETISYIIKEENYSIKNVELSKFFETIDELLTKLNTSIPAKESKKKSYMLKKYSVKNGLSVNTIAVSTSIEKLAKIAEEDMFKIIVRNCTNEFDLKIINNMIYTINIIDLIRNLKSEEDNEIYDYIKLRDFISLSITWYVFPDNESIGKLLNWILNNIFNHKQRLLKNYIKEVQNYISILLSIETAKEKETEEYKNIPSLLSNCLTEINNIRE
jgi:hypothetical protein